jgi:uncharacterized membrane protein
MIRPLLLTFVLLLFALPTIQAQTNSQPRPRENFTIRSATPQLNLTPGQSQTIELDINRAKAFDKVAITLSVDAANLPSGVRLEWESNATLENRVRLHIHSATDTPAGKYPVAVTGKGLNVSRGFVLMLEVGAGAVPVAGSSNP